MSKLVEAGYDNPFTSLEDAAKDYQQMTVPMTDTNGVEQKGEQWKFAADKLV
ncbi:hypothetical protein ADUPG1_005314, partial [Aduncisulcus paluster]